MLLMNEMANNEKIKVEHFEQGPSMCGPASLKILLSHFGKKYTEDQLAKLGSSTLEKGTSHEGMIQAIKEIGGYVFMKENGTIEELRYFLEKEKLPVIINWFQEYEGHYSVVVSITDKNVIIVDPATNEPESWLSRSRFPKIWFDFIGPENKSVSWGWYMVVTFEKRKFDLGGGFYY